MEQPLSRKNSVKAMIYRSLRIPKKPKPPKPVIPKEPTIEEEPTVFLIRRASFNNLQVIKPKQEKRAPPMFPTRCVSTTPCELINCFAGSDNKAFDQDCSLTSFERRRRSQKQFVDKHHAHQQFFCPEQASQIEIHFTSSCSTDVILQVQAPNGETSSYLRPVRDQTVFFNPTKVGCGHGIWKIDIAVRSGCRFRYVRTEEVKLKGQGVVVYNVEPNATIRLKEKLWLNWLN
ncbi:unnamed protein product [Cylicocyclus nassatus]|uniref:Uncharacterized protein n=1 Tax=Cylicocyclus nassatus TaxID=53992 RepID=A0AA36HEH9_CYLNA|nr:unnamed protein product [Cylicocyclus nassatus]